MNNLEIPTSVVPLLGQLSSFSAFTKPPESPKPAAPTAQIDLATLVALVQNFSAQQQQATTPTLTLPFTPQPTITAPAPAPPPPVAATPSPPTPSPSAQPSQSLDNLALEVRALAVQLYQRVAALEKEMGARKEKQAAKTATSALGSMAASKRPMDSSPEAETTKKLKFTEPRCEPLTDEISDVKGEEDSEGESDDDFDGKKGLGKSRRSKLPSYAIEILTNWIMDHKHSPYPSVEEKDRLCELTGMTPMQLNNWFGNARRRILPIARKSSGEP